VPIHLAVKLLGTLLRNKMAIRRPSVSSPQWLCQDFLYQETPDEQERYAQVKWDGQVFTRVSSTFDYSNPPFSNDMQRGGSIVAQIDYSLADKFVTITDWQVNWRDEWPLRVAVNYLQNCLYPAQKGYVIRVAGGEVYNQNGDAIPSTQHQPYSFWVSEWFQPVTNEPNDYLLR